MLKDGKYWGSLGDALSDESVIWLWWISLLTGWSQDTRTLLLVFLLALKPIVV